MSWTSGDVINSTARLRRLSSSIPSAYTVFPISGTYYAESNIAGGTDYSGADASTVINQALDGLTGGRTWKEKVVLKGDFGDVHDVTVPSYTIIEGNGAKLTLSASQNYSFLVSGSTDFEIRNLLLKATRTGRGGEAQGIRGFPTAATNVIVDRVVFEDFYYSSLINAGIWGEFDNLTVENCLFKNAGAGENAFGIYLNSGTTNVLIENDTFSSPHFGNHIYAYDSVNLRIIGNFLNGINTNSQIEGVCLTGCEQAKIVGNDIINCGVAGVLIHAKATQGGCRDVIISENNILNSLRAGGGAGVYVWSDDATISDRLLVTDNTIYNVLTGVIVGRSGQNEGHKLKISLNWIESAEWPVYLWGNAFNVRMLDNTFRVLTNPAGIGTGTLDARNNEGFITENSGSATITNPATSEVVAHGLDVTPSAEHFTIIGKENPTNDVGTIWVDTIGAANFTVNVEAAPGASNWDFGWKVIVI